MDMNADLIDKLVLLRIDDPERYKKYIANFDAVVKDLIKLAAKTNKQEWLKCLFVNIARKILLGLWWFIEMVNHFTPIAG